ncbi:MAG TPA: polysaccharide deacetylase family protein [Terriglobia bacterium]|nr:polysaccharide deacetylase family protein [Terriglobia bacterium]
MHWQGEALIAGLTGSAIYGLYRAVAHPHSKLFGSAFHCGSEGRRQVALTFDDGPDPVWTPRVAAILRRFRIPGTFFCIGRPARTHPDLVRALRDDGHEIGNHSYSHKNLWFRSPAQVREEIERCQEILSDIVSIPPVVFRPPFGDRGPQVLSEARKLKLHTVLWSLDAKDWKSPPAGLLLNRVQRRTHEGAVLLFHDGSHNGRFPDRSSTVAAIAGLVPWLRLQGYEFVTVSALMAGEGGIS